MKKNLKNGMKRQKIGQKVNVLVTQLQMDSIIVTMTGQ